MAERTYEVVGPFVTLGHRPGETFTATIDALLEQQLLDQPAIRIVADTPKKLNAKKED